MNAREELLRILDNAQVKCASISYDSTFIVLKVNHTEEDYIAFLSKLDFDYSNGIGEQHILGTVWLEDGSWLEREEHNGAEWWEHKILPPIPEECLTNQMKKIIIDIHNIIEYYGDISVEILQEVIYRLRDDNEDVVGFTFENKQYTDTLDTTLNTIVEDWKKWWSKNYGEREFN